MELTFGQKAVGLNFNPSGDDAVANCKQGFANEIDRMNDLRGNPESTAEQKRYCYRRLLLSQRKICINAW